MSIKTAISSIRYNAAEQAFEAAVTLQAPKEDLVYPVSFQAPMDTPYEEVSRRLTEAALTRHARGLTALCSHRPTEDQTELMPVPTGIRQATTALWGRVLNRRAS